MWDATTVRWRIPDKVQVGDTIYAIEALEGFAGRYIKLLGHGAQFIYGRPHVSNGGKAVSFGESQKKKKDGRVQGS